MVRILNYNKEERLSNKKDSLSNYLNNIQLNYQLLFGLCHIISCIVY